MADFNFTVKLFKLVDLSREIRNQTFHEMITILAFGYLAGEPRSIFSSNQPSSDFRLRAANQEIRNCLHRRGGACQLAYALCGDGARRRDLDR
jgi:hypothetical protein